MDSILREKIARWLLKSASGGAPIFIGNQHGVPQFNSWDAEKAIREGYQSSTWVYACVKKLADQVASVPLVVWKKSGVKKSEWIRAPEHPLEQLLQMPNSRMTGIQMNKAMTTYLHLAGNHYWYIIEIGGVPRELWPLRPDRVRPIPSNTDFIGGYQYNLDGVSLCFDVNEISHFRFLDPCNDFLGMSSLQAVARIVDTDHEAVDWNKNSMENRAVPPGALVADGNLTEDQFTRLKGEVEQKISGVRNARKPLLLEAGLKWQSFAISPTDMDFIEGRRINREEICAAFGVPPVLVGIQDQSTYNNYETAKRALWEDTIIPYLEDIVAQINQDLTPRFGDNLWVEPDLTEIPALQEKFDDKVTSAQKLWSMGIPFSKLNERLELGMDDIPDADTQWVPSSMVPVQKEDPLEGEPETLKPEREENHSKGMHFVNGFQLETEEQRILYWKATDQQRERYVAPVIKRLRKQFRSEEQKAIESLKRNHGDIGEINSVIRSQKSEWEKLLKSIYLAVMKDFGTSTWEGLKSSFFSYETKEENFDVWSTEIQEWISTVVGKKITQITDTTLELVRKELGEGVQEGEGIPQLANRLRQVYEGFSTHRSVTIARTEVISSSNAASRFAAKQSGLELEKEWISTRDSRTRPSHQHLDRERRAMDESYSNGLLFPGDPSGKANETIKCRCTEGYILKERKEESHHAI
ncbi:phage portal protein [Thermoactinomyces sp. DSM 45892]|uniref:phage portal protein n=1 Tax=Thermoactinomyces sp. DSM 45892 TaxID=1882753 RepID=UPI00089C7B3D|nr:phage portal protein [Thermoactinomyces sp. DSM 45892]SDY22888.1 phage portal protein, HK97 family [Thermoactinomyces sp. DSM 45892]